MLFEMVLGSHLWPCQAIDKPGTQVAEGEILIVNNKTNIFFSIKNIHLNTTDVQ